MPTNNTIKFLWNHLPVEINFSAPDAPRPSTTVLNWLRQQYTGKGTKEGCAEGDCGACTIVAAWPDETGKMCYHAVNSCLIFLPWLHAKHLITVEGLAEGEVLHPVQEALLTRHGTQCGFCTPGIVMSLFALHRSGLQPDERNITEAMSGNLCRCTGYEPIKESAQKVMTMNADDHFTRNEQSVMALLIEWRTHTPHLDHPSQQYFRPTSTGEAAVLQQQHPDASRFCGGTDIALQQTKKFIIPTLLIDLSGIDELRQFSETDSHWSVGAAIPLEELHRLHRGTIPMFDDLLHVFASKQIRELATLGGNLGTASPIGDTWPVLMALGASVVLTGTLGNREIPINEFLTGYRTTQLKNDEVIASIIIPKPNINRHFRYLKLSKRRQMDIATVSLALAVAVDSQEKVTDCIVAMGGMADRPKRATAVEKYLPGQPLTPERIEKASKLLADDFSPISDARASSAGRMVLAQNGLKKGLNDIVKNNLTGILTRPNNHHHE